MSAQIVQGPVVQSTVSLISSLRVISLTVLADSIYNILGPVVQNIISLTRSLRVISLTVLADSIHNILIFFAEKM